MGSLFSCFRKEEKQCVICNKCIEYNHHYYTCRGCNMTYHMHCGNKYTFQDIYSSDCCPYCNCINSTYMHPFIE